MFCLSDFVEKDFIFSNTFWVEFVAYVDKSVLLELEHDGTIVTPFEFLACFNT